MRLSIRNETRYPTKTLRSILLRVMRSEFDRPAFSPALRYRCTVVYARQSYVTGCAVLRGTTMRIRVPEGRCDPVYFAMVATHEVAHLVGERHADMAGKPYRAYGKVPEAVWRARYAWAGAFPLIERDRPARVLVDPVRREAGRVARIEELLRRWEAKKRRAETAIRKYRRPLAYYERRKAAAVTTGGAR